MALRPVNSEQRIKQQDAVIRAAHKEIDKLRSQIGELRGLLSRSSSSTFTQSSVAPVSAREPQLEIINLFKGVANE